MRYSEEITEYIYKQMSPLKREAFELRIENDPELAKEVREQQDMLEAIRAERIYKEAMNDPHKEEADRIAMEILEARKKESTDKRNKVRRISLRMIPAAAIALLLFIDMSFINILSKFGITKRARKRLGLRVGLTKSFGKNIGIRLARFLSWIRKK